MSQQDVELIEGLLSGASEMDRDALLSALPELIAGICTEDVEWVEDPRRADGRPQHGHEAVLASWQRWLEHWDEYGFETERLIDCGGDVLVVATEAGRGARSGASVQGQIYAAVTIRDGKIARYREFSDEQDARRAVGLTPPPG